MKKVLQQTTIVALEDGFLAEDVISGLRTIPGFIYAYGVASSAKAGDLADKVISLWEVNGDPKFADNQRVAWVP